jgi:glycosyltransferase involved in cell wall biosynthesis
MTFYQKKLDIKEPIIRKNFDDERRDIKKFMYLSMNNILLDKDIDLNNYITDNPKISIIIPVYNGERYIKAAITSIQNQDLKDIEIIMIDDYSNDNSVKLINELMQNDKRIILYENKENKGILYTKCFGIYISKGKYILILDEDDIFGQREAFSTLYDLAEKNNLDILGFSSMFTEKENKLGNYIHHYYETSIIYQPNLTKLSHDYSSNGNVKRVGDNIWCYLFKTKTLNDSINQIESRFLNTKMICHDDYLILFLITRNANNFMQIKRIFHIKITYGKPMLYITKAKVDESMDLFCQSYLNYIEFILIKTNNTLHDKKISSYELNRYFLNKKECQNNTYVRKSVIKVCRLFLENKYIKNYVKEKILQVLKEQNIILHFKNK